MVDGREKLSDIERNNASLETSSPSCTDEMCEVLTSIFGGYLTNPPELVWIDNVICNHVMLDVVREHLLDNFP